MKVLAIDTASPRPSLAISTDLLDQETMLPAGPELSSRILPELLEVLSGLHLSLSDLDRIAVVAGPGSFTGIRIGLATAWGLSVALGIPVETESSLAAAAETAPPTADPIPVALPAERGDVYFGLFRVDSGRATAIEDPAIISRAALEARAKPPTFDPDESPPLSLALARAVRREIRPAVKRMEAIYLRDSAAEERRGTNDG